MLWWRRNVFDHMKGCVNICFTLNFVSETNIYTCNWPFRERLHNYKNKRKYTCLDNIVSNLGQLLICHIDNMGQQFVFHNISGILFSPNLLLSSAMTTNNDLCHQNISLWSEVCLNFFSDWLAGPFSLRVTSQLRQLFHWSIFHI